MAEARTSGPGARTSGTANGHGPRQDAAPADGSFDVRLQMLPGITPREEQDFEQGLTRYLQERSLLGEGTPLAMTIRSVEQELDHHRPGGSDRLGDAGITGGSRLDQGLNG